MFRRQNRAVPRYTFVPRSIALAPPLCAVIVDVLQLLSWAPPSSPSFTKCRGNCGYSLFLECLIAVPITYVGYRRIIKAEPRETRSRLLLEGGPRNARILHYVLFFLLLFFCLKTLLVQSEKTGAAFRAFAVSRLLWWSRTPVTFAPRSLNFEKRAAAGSREVHQYAANLSFKTSIFCLQQFERI